MVNPIRNLRQLVLESDLDDATTEFNRLVESVAMATPYHRYVGGLSARCIHCGKKYDPKADPEDAPKHHEPGCIWLWSVELVKLCQTQ